MYACSKGKKGNDLLLEFLEKRVVTIRENTENRKYIFKALGEGIYIWFSLLHIALPDIIIY